MCPAWLKLESFSAELPISERSCINPEQKSCSLYCSLIHEMLTSLLKDSPLPHSSLLIEWDVSSPPSTETSFWGKSSAGIRSTSWWNSTAALTFLPSQLEQAAGMVTPWASSRSPEPRGAGMDPAAEETHLQTALSLFMRSESSGVKLWTRDVSWRAWNIQAHSKHSQDGAGEKEENMRWREGWTEEPVCYLQEQRWGSWKFLSEQQQPVNRSSSVSAGVHDDSPHTPPDHQMVLSKNVWPQTKRNPETFPAVCRRGTIQDEDSKLLLCMILSIWLLKIHWPVLNLKVRCLDFGADRKTDEESLCLFFRGRHFF